MRLCAPGRLNGRRRRHERSREALTLAELSAELAVVMPRPARSHRERAQAQRRQARKRTSPPAPTRTACCFCTRPALEDRYVCQMHAARLEGLSAELRAQGPKGQHAKGRKTKKEENP
jgi:hypothetical protein